MTLRLYKTDTNIPQLGSDYVLTDERHIILAPQVLHFANQEKNTLYSNIFREMVLVRTKALPDEKFALINPVFPTMEAAYAQGDRVYVASPGRADDVCCAIQSVPVTRLGEFTATITAVEESSSLESLLYEFQELDKSDFAQYQNYDNVNKSLLQKEEQEYQKRVAEIKNKLSTQVNKLEEDRLRLLKEISERIREKK